ncbi:MAG TPA: alpha/beta hydrolase [Pseudolysinimonas sp.]|nr:alpha/beta hydrolase [Pseudolysinimonas sp.]
MKISRVVVALVTLSVALSGCALLPALPGSSHSVSTHTDETVASNLKQFYKQDVRWKSCGHRLDCTTLIAPVDWNDPDGEQIELALARQKAKGKSLGSLFVNPGGPGGSGYDMVHDENGSFGTRKVQSNFDVIGFDPRGVGRSTPIVCYTDTADRDEFLYGTYDAPYGSDVWAAELQKRQASWVAACKKNTGELLAHIDSVSVAHDMDMMRAVLGDTKLNYLGYSFGTYLGTIYANLFPEKVGRMVLDGAVEPPFGTFDELATQMAGFDSAFRAYMANCLAGPECPFSGPIDQALAQAHRLVLAVDSRHLQDADGRVLDSATVGTGIAVTLYDEGSWSFLSQAFADLKAGDASTMFILADAYNGRDSGGYLDASIDVYFAVTCAEGTIGTDDISLQQGLAAMQQKGPIVGGILALDDYTLLEAACSQWPYKRPNDFPTSFAAAGAGPILVIGTSNDPATPYSQSVALADTLKSGVLISYEGEGHTVYGNGISCIDSVVDAYFIHDKVPASDPRC